MQAFNQLLKPVTKLVILAVVCTFVVRQHDQDDVRLEPQDPPFDVVQDVVDRGISKRRVEDDVLLPLDFFTDETGKVFDPSSSSLLDLKAEIVTGEDPGSRLDVFQQLLNSFAVIF